MEEDCEACFYILSNEFVCLLFGSTRGYLTSWGCQLLFSASLFFSPRNGGGREEGKNPWMGLCLGRKSFSHQRIYERKISPLPSGYNNEDGELENFEIVPEKVDRVYDVERVHMVVRRLRFFKYYSPHVSTYVYFRGRMPYGNAIVFFEMYATFPPPPFLPRGVIYLSVKYNYPPLLTEICYLYVEPRHCLPGGHYPGVWQRPCKYSIWLWTSGAVIAPEWGSGGVEFGRSAIRWLQIVSYSKIKFPIIIYYFFSFSSTTIVVDTCGKE